MSKYRWHTSRDLSYSLSQPTLTERTTTMTITDIQIERLSREAAEAVDLAQVDICQRALAGSTKARRACERVISEAAAMVEVAS